MNVHKQCFLQEIRNCRETGKSRCMSYFPTVPNYDLNKKYKKVLTFVLEFSKIISASEKHLKREMQGWRNWQTRRLQVPVVAIS